MERALKQPARHRDDRSGIDFAGMNDAGPAQNLDRVDRTVIVAGDPHLVDLCGQRGDQRPVELEVGLARIRPAHVQRAFHLAALHDPCRLLAEFCFFFAEFLGQSELDIEVAVIDRLELPGERANFRFERFAREARHTVQHWFSGSAVFVTFLSLGRRA